MLRSVAGSCSLLLLLGCGDFVVKVEKKPKTVDTSSIKAANEMNLANAEDFLKHLDGLKMVAADVLLKELAKRDYRGEVRGAIRKYRKYLIAKATGPVKNDKPLFSAQGDGDQCRQAGLNFDADDANQFLGMILKTAVLAKLSEAKAAKLNTGGLSKEIAAIGQLILLELGIKVEGDIDVDTSGDSTKTTGQVTVALSELKDEQVDEDTKAADKVEILTLKFERALAKDFSGTFVAEIDLDHGIGAGKTETIAGKLSVKREADHELYTHTLDFSLGVKSSEPSYARELIVEQLDKSSNNWKITDVLNPKTEHETRSVMTLDVKAQKECILRPGSDAPGNEDSFVPQPSPEPEQSPSPSPSPTVSPTPSPTPTPTSTPSPSPTLPPDSGKHDGDKGDDPGLPGGPGGPTQNPTQKPSQAPVQH